MVHDTSHSIRFSPPGGLYCLHNGECRVDSFLSRPGGAAVKSMHAAANEPEVAALLGCDLGGWLQLQNLEVVIAPTVSRQLNGCRKRARGREREREEEGEERGGVIMSDDDCMKDARVRSIKDIAPTSH